MARLIRFFILTLVLAEIGSAGWERRADTPQWQYAGSALVFGIENPKTLYAIFGGTKKLYRYLINLDRWDDSPADFPGDVNFGPGAALASDLNDNIYVLVGGDEAVLALPDFRQQLAAVSGYPVSGQSGRFVSICHR